MEFRRRDTLFKFNRERKPASRKRIGDTFADRQGKSGRSREDRLALAARNCQGAEARGLHAERLPAGRSQGPEAVSVRAAQRPRAPVVKPRDPELQAQGPGGTVRHRERDEGTTEARRAIENDPDYAERRDACRADERARPATASAQGQAETLGCECG